MDLLSDILSHLKLKGTLYFRTSFTAPWGVKVPSYRQVSRFHFAHRGRCLVRIDPEANPVHLEQGDLIIILRGAAHTLYCEPVSEDMALPLDDVLKLSGFTGKGTLVYGDPGTNHETQLICGHFALDEESRHPLIDGLPEYIHIKNYGQSAGAWMESTLKIIGEEACSNNPGSDLIALRLSEIIYAQALREYLSTEEARQSGLAGFTDPAIAKALEAIHSTPGEAWTLERLSATAGVSRTLLATRFVDCLSTTPIGYVTQWRMQLARQMLLDGEETIIDIAERVGYQSEAAFGRVFKKYFDIGPATYRREKKASLLAS